MEQRKSRCNLDAQPNSNHTSPNATMSLINQALKKEQQRRLHQLRDSAEPIPTIHSFDGDRKRDSDSGNLKILLGLLGFGALMLVIGGSFIYFGKAYLADLQSSATLAQAPAEAPTPQTSFASNPNSQNERLQSEPEFPKQAKIEPVEVPSQDLSSNPYPNENLEAIVPAIESASERSGTQTEPQAILNLEFQNYIDSLQVHGYRSAGENSRLLMSGRVFKLNDIVDHERGLIFRGSDKDHLIFEDSSGNQYKKLL
jgi:hypothetical protein